MEGGEGEERERGTIERFSVKEIVCVSVRQRGRDKERERERESERESKREKEREIESEREREEGSSETDENNEDFSVRKDLQNRTSVIKI